MPRQWNDDMAGLTPFQTVGPFLHIGFRTGLAPLPDSQAGSRITIRGQLVDGAGAGIPDGVLEWWHPDLPEVQRSFTGDGGVFAITTIKPSVLEGPDGRAQAPHFDVRILGRGIQLPYVTRMYFVDEPTTADDPILKLVPEKRRATLIARPTTADEYRFDVVVQGDNETVFFDV
jgi:protocatechuate 3,4-dioxygenase alpha subunit